MQQNPLLQESDRGCLTRLSREEFLDGRPEANPLNLWVKPSHVRATESHTPLEDPAGCEPQEVEAWTQV